MTAATRAKRLDIDQLVQEELAWSPTPQPHRIAEAVASRIAEDQLRPALAKALAHVVRRAVSRQRTRAAGVVDGRRADPGALTAQPVYLGVGGWRRFGDCTVASLAETVRHRHSVAEQEAAYTARLERLIEALQAAEAATVDELGLATLAAIFT